MLAFGYEVLNLTEADFVLEFQYCSGNCRCSGRKMYVIFSQMFNMTRRILPQNPPLSHLSKHF